KPGIRLGSSIRGADRCYSAGVETAMPASSSRGRWNLDCLKRIIIRLAALSRFVGVWQAPSKSRTNLIVNFANVPRPTAVAAAAVEFAWAPKSRLHIANSVRRVAIGFGLAFVTAVPL